MFCIGDYGDLEAWGIVTSTCDILDGVGLENLFI